MAEVGLHLLQTPQITLLHTLQNWACRIKQQQQQQQKNIQPIVRLPQHEWILSNNLPPSSPPLFCSRMNEETTLHATDRVMINRVIINVVVEHEQKAPARELVQCYVHTCPIPHCRHPRELIQCQTDWGEDWRELCWHWETVCVCVCIWVVCVKVNWLSAHAPNKSCWENHQSMIATAVWRVGPTSWGSYCPLGLVAARMVHLVFSLHTMQSSLHQQYTHYMWTRLHITAKTWCYVHALWTSSLILEQYAHPSRMYTLATLMVCCSMASWMLARSCSRTLLNSSIVHGGWRLIMHQRSWFMSFYLCSRGLHLPAPELLPPTATHHCPEEGGEIPLSLH